MPDPSANARYRTTAKRRLALCAACEVGYHGMCEAPQSALGAPCGCTRTDVDHDPDWNALRTELGDD